MDALRFEAVTLRLGGVDILDGVTAHVPEGSCTAIVGPNGAGKTSLLKILLGQVAASSGRVHHASGRPRIGYVPQRLHFDRGLPLTVVEALGMGWTDRPGWLGIRRRHRQRAQELLAEVEAPGLIDRPLGALSGGELQRVLLAMALGQEPDLLVLDEPGAGVDVLGEQACCEMTDTLRRRHGFTQLMVSHDLAVVTAHAEHVICLNRRCIAEGTPREVLSRETLRATFGRHLGLPDPHVMADDAVPEGHHCHLHPPRIPLPMDVRTQHHA